MNGHSLPHSWALARKSDALERTREAQAAHSPDYKKSAQGLVVAGCVSFREERLKMGAGNTPEAQGVFRDMQIIPYLTVEESSGILRLTINL